MLILRFLRRLLPFAIAAALATAALLATCHVVGTWLIGRAESGPVDQPPGRMLAIAPQRTYVRERGAGPPLVLLHGLPGSSADWPGAFVDRLARSHRVVAIDLAGLGYSDRPADGGTGPEAWAVQVASALGALALTDALVVGHDAGAITAVLLAADHPRLVSRLVLIAPAVPLDRDDEPRRTTALRIPGLGELLAGWSERTLVPASAPAGVADGAWWSIPGTRRGVLAALRRGVDPERLRRALRTVQAPTLAVHGSVDTVVSEVAARRWIPSIAGVLLRPLPDLGHWPAHQAPEVLADLVLDFERGAVRRDVRRARGGTLAALVATHATGVE